MTQQAMAVAAATIIAGVVSLAVLLMQIKFYERRRRRDYMSSIPQGPLDSLKAVIDNTADALPGLASTGPGNGIQQISDAAVRFKHGAISFDGLDVPPPVVEEYARCVDLIDELQRLAAQPNSPPGIAAGRVSEILAGLKKHYTYLRTAQW